MDRIPIWFVPAVRRVLDSWWWRGRMAVASGPLSAVAASQPESFMRVLRDGRARSPFSVADKRRSRNYGESAEPDERNFNYRT